MAGEEDKEKKENIMDKLKELEASLAKELDQKVRLAEPTDPRLEGTVDVNPNMEQALQKAKQQLDAPSANEKKVAEIVKSQTSTPPPSAAGQEPLPSARPVDAAAAAEKQVDEITLEDVDDLLDQVDAGFRSSIAEIKNEIGIIEAPPNLESIAIGADYLKEAEGKDAVQALPAVEEISVANVPSHLHDDLGTAPSLVKIAKAIGQASGRIPVRFVKKVIKEIPLLKANPRDSVFQILRAEVDDLRTWVGLLLKFFSKLTNYSAKTYRMVVTFLVLLGAVFYLLHDVYNNFRPDREKDPFLRSFNDVADTVQVFPDEDEGEDLESPLRHSEYMVLVRRMVANLKAPNRWSSPMVVVELYIEASNQDCAIEIHNRQGEVRDIIDRTLEQSTFEDLDTAAGKARLKLRIRKNLNRILNKGTAKHIMFKSLNLKK